MLFGQNVEEYYKMFNLIDIPDNTEALLNTWIKKFGVDDKHLIFTGVAIVFWTIWKFRTMLFLTMLKSPTLVSIPC